MTVEWNTQSLGLLESCNPQDTFVTIVDSLIARVRFINNDLASDALSNVSVIESDPSFVTTRKTLLQLAPVAAIVPYTILSFIALLDLINKKDKFAYIKKRPESSLNQIYVVTLLLSDFTETNWRLKERSELSSISSRSTEDSDKEFPHRIPADPLESDLVMKSLQVLVKLKSFKKARSIIRQLDGSSAYFELASSNQTIADIDYNLDAIVRYLSSASPLGYSKTTEIAVSTNADITNYDILGYLEYLAFLNLSPQTFEKEFQLLIYFTESFKNIYIQHIHSSFFIDCVISYSTCYTKDFLETIAKPEIHKVGDAYFEKIYPKYRLAPENEKKFYLRALAASLVIMPKQLELFLSGLESVSNKRLLKGNNVNKKQKLLHHVTKNIYEGGDKVPTLEFFMVIFNVASVIIQYDPEHPLVVVAKAYVLQVYNVLNPSNNAMLMVDTDISAIDKIRIEFYSLAIVLAPDLIKPKVINIIANPDTSLQFYYIVTHAIRNLIRRPYHKEFAYKLIDTIAITLRDHCGKLAKIVHETMADYDSLMSDASSSSRSFRYTSSSYTGDSRTVLSSKYSSTTLGLPTAVSNTEPESPSATPESTNLGSTLGASLGDMSLGDRHLLKVKEKTKSKKDAAFSFLSSFSREKRISATVKPTQSTLTNVKPTQTSSTSLKPSQPTLVANVPTNTNSDRISVTSNTAKPINVLNMEYCKRVENPAFLSREILKLIFQIFRSYSAFFFKLPSIYADLMDKSPNAYIEAARQTKTILFELKRILDPLLVSLADNDQKLVDTARRLVVRILDNEEASLLETYIALFSSCYLQSGFIDISLTCQLFEPKFLEIISFTTLFWTKRNKIIEKINMDELFDNIGDEGMYLVQKCFEDSEKLILVVMSTPGTDFYRILKLNCNLFIKEIEGDSFLSKRLRKRVNFALYKSLAEENYFVSSPVALQKRLRRKLSEHLSVYSEGMLQAMDIVYERWKDYHSVREPSHNEEVEHRNYGGFFAIVLGGIMKPELENSGSCARKKSLEYFISKQNDLLNSDDLKELENAKDLLANELHPYSHHYIIRKVQKELGSILVRKDRVSSMDTSSNNVLASKEIMLLDAYVSVLIGFLNISDKTVSFTHSADMKAIALSFIQLLKGSIGTESVALIRLKIRVCRFLQKFSEDPDSLVLRGCSDKWKNSLIQVVSNWLDAICFGNSIYNNYNLFQNIKQDLRQEMDFFISFELALECLKSIGFLFKKCVIYPFGVQYQSEVRFVQTVTFVNYFNLFSRILENCLEHTPKTTTLSAIERKIELIKDQAVVVISNMLEYNYDVGIQYAMPLAFHKNLKIKHASMNVFKNIVKTIRDAKTKKTAQFEAVAFSRFVNVLCTNVDILIAMVRSMLASDYDTFPYNMLEALESSNYEVARITDLVDYELEMSPKIIDTLRKNSIPAKMLSLYAKKVGAQYLPSVLRPVVEEMSDKQDIFEVEKSDTPDNVDRFFYYLNRIVDSICESVATTPWELRILCSNIRRLVHKRTADYTTAILVISSFLFLRFVCPAIVSPTSENIIDGTPSVQQQRNYIQLAKVFQNLANDSIPSIKYKAVLSRKNELETMRQRLVKFLDEMSSDKSVQVPAKPTRVVSQEVFTTLYSLVIHRNDELSLHLMHPTTPRKSSVAETVASIHVLQDVSIDIGQRYLRFTPAIPAFVTVDAHPELYEMFKRYKDLDDSFLIECPFVTQSYARDGTLLVVFSHQYFAKVAHYDVDMLIFRTVQVCQKKWDEPFMLVMDCSFFDPRCSERFQRYFCDLTAKTRTFWDNCLGASYYNVNPAYAQLVQDGLQGSAFEGMLTKAKFLHAFYSPFDNLSTLIALGTPNWSIDAVKDTQLTIDCLIYLSDLRRYVPVVIKIGRIYVFWSSVVKELVVQNQKKYMRVTCSSRVSDWIDASDSNFINNDGNEFQVTVKNHGILRLSSAKKSEILKKLFLARLGRQTDVVTDYQASYLGLNGPGDTFVGLNGPSDTSSDTFLGSILASVLLNMISQSENVRNTAFDTIVLLVGLYKLQINRNIISEGSTFPKDSVPYVLDIAKALADNHPELTSDFISAITEGYDSSENKYGCLMLLSLWIKNIHTQYHRRCGARGTQRIEEIIHRFVERIPGVTDDLLLTFKQFVWKGIVSDVHLVEYAVADIIREALKKEIQGDNWDNIDSVISSFPTIDVCGLIIKQLRQVVDMPLFTTDRQVSVTISWIKARILVKVCESLAFDALFLAETYFAELCFIVSMLVNVGPYDLRVSVRNLVINVLHSFLSKKSLSEAARTHVLRTIEDLSGPGAKITFGLVKNNDSYAVIPRRPDQLFASYTHLESFCGALLLFIELQPTEMKNIWKGRWASFVLSAAFRQHGPLQGRGILVSGILCRSGISDSVIIEFVRKYIDFCTSDLAATDLSVSVCFHLAFASFAEALTPISQYTGFMFCIGFAHCALDNTIYFQTALRLFANHVSGMRRNGLLGPQSDYRACLAQFQAEYPYLLGHVQAFFGLHLDTGAVDQVFLYYAVKALQVPYMKRNGYDLLLLLFRVRGGYDIHQAKKHSNWLELVSKADSISYLLMLFISGVHGENHTEIMQQTGLDPSRVIVVNNVQIPLVLVEFLHSQTDNAIISTYQVSAYFCNEHTDVISQLRYVLLLNTLDASCADLLLYAYLIIKDTLVKLIESSGSIDILQASYAFVQKVSNHPQFETPEIVIEKFDSLLENYKITGIKNTFFRNHDLFSEEETQRIVNHPLNPILMKFYFDKANAFTRVD